MPITIEIDHTTPFVRVTAEGPVVLRDVLDYFDKLVVEGAMPYPKLFDASNAVPHFSDDDVMVLGARVSAYAAFEPRGPLALVARNAEARLIVHRFMNLGRPQRPARLFDTAREALAWLKGLKEA